MSQPTSDKQDEARETAREKERIQHERGRWWELAETYRRCVRIARDEWDAELERATAEQEALATRMRDRIREGTRATGVKYEVDYGIPAPLLTPRDKLQFVKECSVTLFIEACKKSLPVTPEGKRATQEPDEATPADAEGTTVAAALDVEAHELAQAGETAGPEEAAPRERRRRAVSHSP